MGRRIDGNELRVMETLWRDQFYGAKRGLTSAQLGKVLSLSIVTINDVLLNLRGETSSQERKPERRSWPLVVDGDTVRTGGRRATTHMIDIENVITWPSTAIIVLHLFGYDGGNCPEKIFLENVTALGLIDRKTSEAFESGRIQSQISFAVEKGYFGRVPNHPDTLSITERAVDEYDYLTAISKDTKGSPAS